MKMAFFFDHYCSEGRGIFTIGKCGAKFKILKCWKQTLSPFPQQSTLAINKILVLLYPRYRCRVIPFEGVKM
jgi:hypothetical protein